MTTKEIILKEFKKDPIKNFSCQQLTNICIKKQKLAGQKARNKSGSVSSILAKMVKDNILQYSKFNKTTRGGHLYELYNYELDYYD